MMDALLLNIAGGVIAGVIVAVAQKWWGAR